MRGPSGRKAVFKTLPEVPDEVFTSGRGTEELLEIRACRRKEDWNPPRTVALSRYILPAGSLRRRAAAAPFPLYAPETVSRSDGPDGVGLQAGGSPSPREELK